MLKWSLGFLAGGISWVAWTGYVIQETLYYVGNFLAHPGPLSIVAHVLLIALLWYSVVFTGAFVVAFWSPGQRVSAGLEALGSPSAASQ